MKKIIAYLKKLIYKRKKKSQHLNVAEKNICEKIKEMNITNAEKIELLIKDKLFLENDKLVNNEHLYHDLGCDGLDLTELMSDIEGIFNIEIQELAFPLTVGGLKEYVEKKINNPNFIVPKKDLFYEKPGWGWTGLALTLHNESLWCRSKAIQDLINNNYQMLNHEQVNPFKELINFTLNYFEKLIAEKPSKAEKLLQNLFPLMKPYILRQILKHETINTNDNEIDEQKAFDEFLIFCKNVFCTLYSDKESRDKHIKQEFKLMHNDLISFIEEVKNY